jgi:glutamate-1-semialdehyde 2,1-aminomutase
MDRVNQSLEAVVAEAEQRYIAANPNSAALNARARGALPGGNTRTTLHYGPFPLHLRGGSGSRVTDVDGHDYIDVINEYTAGLFGHSEPKIQAVLKTAIDDGLTLGGPNVYEADLAALIAARFPSMERLRFCNSGTEANLLAVAAARAITGRAKIMVFDGAYHGSLFYIGLKPSPMNMPIPLVVSRYNDAEAAAADIKAHAGELAAVLLEPLQGSGGAVPAEIPFLTALREGCNQHGIVLIYDEVMTSRLGPNGLQGRLGILPDMTTLGKYVGGGMTIGAFGGKAEIMDRFDPARPDALPHGGTFNNNVLAMAAGRVAFTEVLTEAVLGAMNALGDTLIAGSNALARKHDVPLQATGIGSIFGLHFQRGPIRSARDLAAAAAGREAAIADLKKLYHLDMLARGIYSTRRIMGSLSLANSEADIARFLAALDDFMAERGSLIRAVAG